MVNAPFPAISWPSEPRKQAFDQWFSSVCNTHQIDASSLQVASADAAGQHVISVKMTLTAQGCGMGPVIADDAKTRIEALKDVSSAQVDIVWDPPWTPHMISTEGRLKLGIE